MGIFVATFTAVAVTAAQDVFEILAPANSRVALRSVSLGQYSDAGDAQEELLSIQIIRGHATSGSGGTAPTPVNLAGHAGAASAASTVEVNNTTIASTGTPLTLLSDVFKVDSGWCFRPECDERPTIIPGERLVVRISAPADSLTMNGTIVFEELGKMPIS